MENNSIKKSESKLKELEKKKAALNEKIKLERNKLNAKKRKERTKRLIEKGAVLESLQGSNAEKLAPDQTLNWIKQNIASEREKGLVRQLKVTQDELKFFKRTAKKWTLTNDDGSKITVTEFIHQQWLSKNKQAPKN
ncbi:MULTISPECIES: hypothetical protein [Lactobacillaceae]|uniref:hypothetical protein n=1 Tax=Lactobacillaceae TaxID=33958 RepID=UPI00143526C8|nr:MULTISPECIES: hypothetical protein [Lactobacillaceae]BDI02928.1 hypothetical protein LmYK1_21680 [Ligilactobacillus murinus]GFI62899.1 hypothetical protein IMSAG117_00305 [Lactobacillaceae bacterium]